MWERCACVKFWPAPAGALRGQRQIFMKKIRRLRFTIKRWQLLKQE
jgi:hypothetical protein